MAKGTWAQLVTVATDPIFRNWPGKIGLEVGWRPSLFNLTEPSSPERVGDHKACHVVTKCHVSS